MHQFQPWREYLSIQLINGNFPIYTTSLFSGSPFLANMQSAFFYPFSILFFLFNFILAFKIYIYLNFLICFIFIVLFTDKFTKNIKIAVFAGINFCFGFYYLSRIEFLSEFGTLSLVPLIFLIASEFKSRGNIKTYDNFTVIILSIVFVFQIYSGHPQMFLYTIFAVILFQLINKVSIKNIFLILLFISLLAAPQIVPSFEFFLNSSRYKMKALESSLAWNMPLQNLKTLLIPFYFGEKIIELINTNFDLIPDDWKDKNWGIQIYFGIISLFFSLIGLIDKRTYRKKIFSSLIVIFVLFFFLASGKELFLGELFYKYIRILTIFHHPLSFFYFIIFSLSIFSAIGLKYCITDTGLNKKMILMIFMISLFFLIKITITENIYRKNLFYNSYLYLLFFLIIYLFLYILNEKNYFSKTNIRKLNNMYYYNLTLVAVYFFVFFDLLNYSEKINPSINDKIFNRKPEILNLIIPGSKIYCFDYPMRIFHRSTPLKSYAFLREQLHPNISLPFCIKNVFGYDPLMISNYRDLFREHVDSGKLNYNFMKFLGVKYILTFSEIDNKLKKFNKKKYSKINIYENIDIGQDFFVPETVKVIPDKNKRINHILSDKFNPKEIILDKKQEFEKGEIISFENGRANKYKLLLNSNPKTILATNLSYYPGFKAISINENNKIKSCQIIKINNSFIGITNFNNGIQKLYFFYQPKIFRIGLWIFITFNIIIIFNINLEKFQNR